MAYLADKSGRGVGNLVVAFVRGRVQAGEGGVLEGGLGARLLQLSANGSCPTNALCGGIHSLQQGNQDGRYFVLKTVSS